MDKDLREYYMNNLNIVSISECRYSITFFDDLHPKKTNYISKRLTHILDDLTRPSFRLVKLVPVRFLMLNKKLFLHEPEKVIDTYYFQRPLDFVDFDYDDNSFYVEYNKMKNKHDIKLEAFTIECTLSYHSNVDDIKYVTDATIIVPFPNYETAIACQVTTLKRNKKDVISEYVFDDITYFNKNVSDEMLQHLFVKYLKS